VGTPPAAEAVARVLLLRHGESTWNVEARWQGRADPPLSPAGEGQARQAAAALTGAVAVWSSDLARACRTAELLAPADVTVRVDARLRERDVGSWTALTRAEIDGQFPGWLADGRRPSGWEGDDAVRARCWPALRAAAAPLAAGDVAVVVSHGGLIRAVVAELGPPAWPVPNLGGVWLERVAGGLALGPRVALIDTIASNVGAAPAVQPD
jgi:glucosyl-3-phosphoglycerate phosphatase